ncbi:hypothetical protein [Mesorhizobium sp. M0227]|uniref:hypothetical protein n=1 Tax=Mesorhizobium sp. M0227 TaxID=2956922 RepID=UPI0033396981
MSEATVSPVLARAGLSRLNTGHRQNRCAAYQRVHLGHPITGRYPGAVNRHLGIAW